MNFYKHHIGDYAKKTGALSMTEHGAYLLMLHAYYGTEKPLPFGRDLYRICRAFEKKEQHAIDKIAELFWTKTEDGYINGRAFEEIETATKSAEHSRQAGKLGGNPKKKAGYNEPGFVYAIQKQAGGPIKVGISKFIASRISSLRSKLGPINVLMQEPVTDMGAAEAAVHGAFTASLDGEWINLEWSEISLPIGQILAAYRAENVSLIQTPDSTIQTPSKKKTVRGPTTPKLKKCPAEFIPDSVFALAEIPDVDVNREIAKFKDWEFKSPRSDWAACWRTWIRTARDRNQYSKQQSTVRKWD